MIYGVITEIRAGFKRECLDIASIFHVSPEGFISFKDKMRIFPRDIAMKPRPKKKTEKPKNKQKPRLFLKGLR